MKKFSTNFSAGNVFFALYAVFFVGIAIVLILFSKAELHLYLNKLHNPFLDSFFFYVTQLGHGLFVMFVVVILLFFRYRYALGVFITFALSGIIAQLIKHIANVPRPVKYFEHIADLHLVEGVKMLTSHSFPSGHAASAFALCLSLAIMLKNRVWQVLMFLLAMTIAYSRVYLSQHFMVDIWVGSAIGILVGAFYWYLDQKLQWQWLDDSLLRRNTHKQTSK